jgi:hypothetical protein
MVFSVWSHQQRCDSRAPLTSSNKEVEMEHIKTMSMASKSFEDSHRLHPLSSLMVCVASVEVISVDISAL